jgi:hypothetical protein
MLKRVNDLTARAYDLGDRVFSAMPCQYRDRTNAHDYVGQAWVSAMGAVADAWRSLDDLGKLLAEKAGGLAAPPPISFPRRKSRVCRITKQKQG